MKRTEKRHILIPRHIKLSDKEKKELLEKYNISLVQLPRVGKKDAALVGLGTKRGDVIKIVRQSLTSGESIFYRVVV